MLTSHIPHWKCSLRTRKWALPQGSGKGRGRGLQSEKWNSEGPRGRRHRGFQGYRAVTTCIADYALL